MASTTQTAEVYYHDSDMDSLFIWVDGYYVYNIDSFLHDSTPADLSFEEMCSPPQTRHSGTQEPLGGSHLTKKASHGLASADTSATSLTGPTAEQSSAPVAQGYQDVLEDSQLTKDASSGLASFDTLVASRAGATLERPSAPVTQGCQENGGKIVGRGLQKPTPVAKEEQLAIQV